MTMAALLAAAQPVPPAQAAEEIMISTFDALPILPENLEQECDYGNARACTRAGRNSYGRKKMNEAIRFFSEGCKLNDAAACSAIGDIYYGGDGIKQDYAKARQWYNKACDLNNVDACGLLGYMYFTGTGVAQNHDQYMKYYAKQCTLGGKKGCETVAMNGQKRDKKYYKDINTVLSEDCGRGSGDACAAMGAMYDLGNLVKRDSEIAVDFFKKACNFKNYFGCYVAGSMYEEGKRLEQNLSAARRFYKRACDLDGEKGCEEYRRLNEQPVEEPQIDINTQNDLLRY